MAEETSLLQQAFAECGEQLDRIIAGMQRKDLAKTYAYYSNGSIVEYDIVGNLGVNVISGTNLVKVEIGTTVTSIGDEAFSDCSSLTDVMIRNGVTSIGNYAFYTCSGLTSVAIPASVTSIGYEAFYGCSKLTSVTIPNSVTSIGQEAFSGCSGLTSVTIGNSVTNLGSRAFFGCSGLTSVAIPASVTSIGVDAFYDTSIMNTYMTTKSLAEVQAMDNYPWGLPAGGIIHCSDGDLVVPESGGSGS